MVISKEYPIKYTHVLLCFFCAHNMVLSGFTRRISRYHSWSPQWHWRQWQYYYYWSTLNDIYQIDQNWTPNKTQHIAYFVRNTITLHGSFTGIVWLSCCPSSSNIVIAIIKFCNFVLSYSIEVVSTLSYYNRSSKSIWHWSGSYCNN